MTRSKRSRSPDAPETAPHKRAHTSTSAPASRNITTRSMSRTSVSNAVFLTTELLENILRFLPARTLLQALRVCRKWRDVITQSPPIQETLFLKQERPTIAWKWSCKSHDKYRMDRLADLPTVEPRYNDNITLSARLNSMVLKDDRFNGYSTAETAPGEIFGFAGDACWRLKEGSWRRMFVTQPPASTVDAEYILGEWEASRSGYDSDTVVFSQRDGVTVGKLVDHGLKLQSEGQKVNWDRCWFQAWCRVFPSEAEAEMRTITS
ncbi:hypothetical protein LTR85_012132 [Meristemomyces frigidus]|nr:hypothetical protein LTR85_012132 [Meristemomyces frigidus]